MNTREAYRLTLKHMIEFLIEEGKLSTASEGAIKEVVENMHSDMFFIGEFADFLQDFLEESGDRYGM